MSDVVGEHYLEFIFSVIVISGFQSSHKTIRSPRRNMNDDTNALHSPDILDFVQDFALTNSLLTLELERLQEGTIFSLLNDFGDYNETANGALLSEPINLLKDGFYEGADCDGLRIFSTPDPGNTLHESVQIHTPGHVKQNSEAAVVLDNERYLSNCVEHDHTYCTAPVG